MMEERKQCKFCYETPKIRNVTSTQCSGCELFLCLTKARNCFSEYHCKLFGGEFEGVATPTQTNRTLSMEIPRLPRLSTPHVTEISVVPSSAAPSNATPTIKKKRKPLQFNKLHFTELLSSLIFKFRNTDNRKMVQITRNNLEHLLLVLRNWRVCYFKGYV
jgi:hypothetical protein